MIFFSWKQLWTDVLKSTVKLNRCWIWGFHGSDWCWFCIVNKLLIWIILVWYYRIFWCCLWIWYWKECSCWDLIYISKSFHVLFSWKITVFWNVTPGSLVESYQHSGGTYYIHLQGNTLLPWSWRQQVPSKLCYLSTKLHSVLSQDTVVFMQDLRFPWWWVRGVLSSEMWCRVVW
jgi:hypothetical protein